jgi:hypothetical protein
MLLLRPIRIIPRPDTQETTSTKGIHLDKRPIAWECSKQKLQDAVNDRLGISIANNSA